MFQSVGNYANGTIAINTACFFLSLFLMKVNCIRFGVFSSCAVSLH